LGRYLSRKIIFKNYGQALSKIDALVKLDKNRPPNEGNYLSFLMNIYDGHE
jgi:hypothetical protein